jgi:hypothetical protein
MGEGHETEAGRGETYGGGGGGVSATGTGAGTQEKERVAVSEHKRLPQEQPAASADLRAVTEAMHAMELGGGSDAAIPAQASRGGDGGDGVDADAHVVEAVGRTTEEVDTELVAKCLSDGIHTESKLILSVFDYGGQSIFNVIHHFFLTRYGVYLLVFNMEWLGGDAVQRNCLDYLRFWLNSVVIHTLNKKVCITILDTIRHNYTPYTAYIH